MVDVYTSRTAYRDEGAMDITVKSGNGPGKCLAPTWDLVAGFKLYEAQEAKTQAEQANDKKQLDLADAEIERWGKDKLTGGAIQPLNEKDYSDKYLELLRKRYQNDKQPFLDILEQESVILLCYCASGEFCHRHLATGVLEKIAKANNIPFTSGGELDPYTHRPYVAPDAPNYQTVGTTVLPIVDPKGKDQLGWSVTAVLNAKDEDGQPKRHLLEVAHYAPPFIDSAQQHAESLIDHIKSQRLPLRGGADDVRDTVKHLQTEAKTNGLSGKLETLTPKQLEVWEHDRKAFALAHTPKGMHIEPGHHELFITALPIVDDKRTCIGFSTAAVMTQEDKQSVLEVAHFESIGRKRAEEYAQQLADDVQQKGFMRYGSADRLDKTVQWLGQQTEHNQLDAHWQPLDASEQARLAEGRLQLEHERREVKPL